MNASSSSRRAITLIALGAFVVLVVTVLYVWGLVYRPAYGATIGPQKFVRLATVNGQRVAYLHLNIVQTVNNGPHPDWLGYQALDGKTPGTIFHLPTNTLVHVTITNYDSQTPPRNEFFSLVQGTVGGVERVNGKTIKVMDPAVMSHTFTIPDLGVSVPMMGIPASGKPDHETMTFSFRTRGPGNYRWQCIVPCGSGTYGFGGPMSELGYMSGMINVS